MQHIIAPFNEFAANAWHEDIWHAFELARRFERQQLTYQLWSPDPLSATSISRLKALNLSINLDIQHTQPYRGIVPSEDNLWIMGETHIGPWYDYHQYQTISVIYDTIRSDRFFQYLHRLRKKPAIELDIIHISKTQAAKSGLASRALDCDLLDIDFWTGKDLPETISNSTYTIGRISPDLPEWHHYDDPKLYRLLAQGNIHVKLAGADSIKSFIESNEKVEFYNAEFRIEKFISSIDCLVCRSSPKRTKSFMPSISLAIKYGIPVITDSRNPLAHHLSQYSKSYIANTNDQIIKTIISLSGLPKLKPICDQGGDA